MEWISNGSDEGKECPVSNSITIWTNRKDEWATWKSSKWQ